MTTQKQFTDLLYEIEPSISTVNACSSAHTTLRAALKSDEEFAKVHKTDFLSGSYKRDTAIRPQKIDGVLQRPDVDIIVVTKHTKDDDPDDVLTILEEALRDAGYKNVKVNRRSIAVTLSTVDMDVVPIIENGLSYLIPDKQLGQWLTTNPPAHTQWTIDENSRTGGRFKPLVKLFKWWRRVNLADLRRPKGFILECVVSKFMNATQSNYETLFVELLESISDGYAGYAAAGLVPFLEDPGVPGNNVFSHVTAEEFQTFYDKVKEHAKLARDAKNETDDDKALKKWRDVLGSCFPAAASSRSAASSLVRPAVGLGLSFPAVAAVPNKPSGFA